MTTGYARAPTVPERATRGRLVASPGGVACLGMSGARTWSIFTRILAPLLVPGILASSILVLVRTVGTVELTFLTAGPDSSTLLVALFNSMNAAGMRAQQYVDAMAVIYLAVMMTLRVIALRFVNRTQLVAQVKEEPEP